MSSKVWQYNKVVKTFPTKLQALTYCFINNFQNKIKNLLQIIKKEVKTDE